MFSYTLASSLLLSVAFGGCNYAVWEDALALITDTCYSCDGDDCGGLIGVKAECADDDASATITYYTDTSCETVYTTTSASLFNCGATGSCSSISMDGTIYTSSDCTGNSTGVFEVELASSVCLFTGAYYYGISTTTAGLYLGTFINDSCAGEYSLGGFDDGGCVVGVIGDSATVTFYQDDDSSSSLLDVSVFTFITAIAASMGLLFY